jgi:SPP1 family predicted phage head-tail adaptor
VKIRRASKLRHRITIEEPVKTRNDLGQIDKSNWIAFDSRLAEWRTLSARESERMREIKMEASIAVTIRYREGITTAMRCKLGDKVAYISAAIDEDQRKETLILYCTEQPRNN